MPLIRGWIDALRQRTSVEAFSDMTLAPLSLDDVANGVVGVLDDREGGGIYHLSGQSDISYFQVAGHLASRLGVPSSFVHSARAADRIPPSELMHYTTLDVGRISKLTGWAAPEPLALINQVFGPVLAAKPATR
jgi:dTDP-4-dehydrorhamnose reductase